MTTATPQGHLYVFMGSPGAGKTTAAKMFRDLSPKKLELVDKDHYFEGIDDILHELGPTESVSRDALQEAIKEAEYGFLHRETKRIRAEGKDVVLVAPYTLKARDPEQWSQVINDCGGGRSTLVWVKANIRALKAHWKKRDAIRDHEFMKDPDGYVKAFALEEPPVARHLIIDNSLLGTTHIESQLEQMFGLSSGRGLQRAR